MFSHKSSISPTISTRLMFAAGLLACLVWLAVSFSRGHLPDAGTPASTTDTKQASAESRAGAATLEGETAHNYLERTAEGQSLMKTLTTARFGLERREESPFGGDAGAGYLGMSHDENLNAWFDNEGVTVRPTLPQQERAKSWRMRMRLRAYGYGAELHEARKHSAPTVDEKRENRIEYERARSEAGARVVEWYVNKAEGIEQGFTLDERPRRGAGVPESEPLRLAVSVTGDLRARASEARDSRDSQAVELHRGDETVLSYSKLVALDATGQKLAAWMETSATGDEIALVVDDKAAQYPIIVDPITATQKQELAGGVIQTDARFGFSVAIQGFFAVVGAWREDDSGLLDLGAVYFFARSGNSWSFDRRLTGDATGWSCGWSVAVSGNRILYGCPGANNSKGIAFLVGRTGLGSYTSRVPLEPDVIQFGDRYGESVAINVDNAVVGAPLHDDIADTDAGAIFYYTVNPDLSVPGYVRHTGEGPNHRFGTSVDVNDRPPPDDIIIAGSPGADAERGRAYSVNIIPGSITIIRPNPFAAADAAPGDRFGQSVAMYDDTAVIAAPTDDNERGVDAGAAYVFVGVSSQSERQQQKLTASDGRPGDFFGEHAIAIEGNTLVVGAYSNGQGGDPLNGIPDDDRGAAYVFTRSGTVWTQQAKISQGNFAGGEAGDHFGIDVDISFNTLLVGARTASSGSTLRAGAAFIYELDCTAPYDTEAWVSLTGVPTENDIAVTCPGRSAFFIVAYKFVTSPATFQWRRNGVNIPGATNNSYSISNVSASDAGSYDVIFSTACGTDISAPATLLVFTFSLNPTSQNFSASGSNGVVNVTATGSSCGWTATSNASWINITSGSSGTGNGTVGFNVAANSGAQRTGTLSVAGETFNVTQDGAVASASTVQFSQSTYSRSEGAGGATVTVTRTGDLSSAVTVEYATTDGSATDRGDYNTTIGRLRFAAGEGAKNFTVLLNDDAYAEGTQSLNLTLSNPTGGAALGSPFAATLSIEDNDASTATANPLDSTGFFVRQQYVDFFSREADAPGLSFWTNNIDSCGANVGCREVKRIDTSAAFFLSIEFQETGFLVHRLYRASFSRLTRYREFVRDLQEIGRGVVVNSPGWEALLETNKQVFTSEFAARADFQGIYGGMTNAQYVDALNANTGGSLSTAQRDALVAGLNGATETRATALRKVAEDADFRARETSPAFVLLQYFGYLRRNPDDPPEPGLNFDGYNFWLAKLNSFGGDFRQAEMVKSFLVSVEYRTRFGP